MTESSFSTVTWTSRWRPWLVGLAVFILYRLTAVPLPLGAGALFELNQHLGVDPFPSLTQRLWGIVLQVGDRLPGTASGWAATFACLCAGAVAAMVSGLASQWFVWRSDGVESEGGRKRLYRAGMLAGLLAPLLLASYRAFWLSASHATSLPWEIMLVLLPFYLLLGRGGVPSLRGHMIAVFLYGVAVTESSTAILFAPFFGVLLLYQLAVAGNLRFGVVFGALGAGLLGLGLYVVSAWLYARHPVYEWREFKSFWGVLWYLWHAQYLNLTATVPRHGWLTVALVSFLPLVLALFFGSPSGIYTSKKNPLGANILLALFFVLGVALWFDPPLSPWRLTGMLPLLVTPWVLTSLWLSMISGYFLVRFLRVRRLDRTGLTAVRRLVAILAMAIPTVLALVFLARTPGRIGREISHLVRQAAEETLVDLDGRPWFLSGGILDDAVALRAHETGHDLNIIDVGYGRSKPAMRYVASLFDNRRYQSLAHVGLDPLLNEWTTKDPGITEILAVDFSPEVWASAGLEAVPYPLLYRSMRTGVGEVDPEALMARHREVWSGLGQGLLDLADPGEGFAPWRDVLLLQLSRSANNLGVFLEDRDAWELARLAYTQSRRFETNNLSALLNLHNLAVSRELPERDALEAELRPLLEHAPRGWQSWALARSYGYVRAPEAYAQRGMSWAMSGRPALAIQDLKKASSLSGDQAGFQLALAGLYFAQDMDVASEETYRALLERDPDQPAPILGLLRLAARRGAYEEARSYLDQLRRLGVSEDSLQLEEAILLTLEQRYAEAVSFLRPLVKNHPNSQSLWAALALNASQLGDQELVREARDAIENMAVVTPALRLVLAQHAIREGSVAEARRQVESVLQRSPGHIQALEMSLRLDLMEGNRELAQRHAERLLRVAPGNALGNYILGTLQYAAGDAELAESSFRASLETQRSTEALNDLAWVLNARGDYEEAEALIREALERNDGSAQMWDTYGVILMNRSAFEDAESALLKSLAIRPDAVATTLHLAMLKERQGLRAEALRMTETLQTRLAELSLPMQAQFRELQSRLRGE